MLQIYTQTIFILNNSSQGGFKSSLQNFSSFNQVIFFSNLLYKIVRLLQIQKLLNLKSQALFVVVFYC